MTEKEIVNDMKMILEEMKHSEGLPPKFATEAQLWDEIMKREAWNMPQQLFPLIKEIHGKDYPEGTTVRPLATEFSVERGDTKEIASVRADITVLIGERDIYHFECEIKYDGTIVMRMFEYDIHIGLSYQKLEEHPQMQFSFPRSAVIYLQSGDNIPDQLSCSLRFPDGSVHDYNVPTMKVQNYSLEEIRQKHLCILIPFLPLRFRKFFNTGKNVFELKKEELTSFYRQLILILEEEVEAGFLSDKNRSVIINLLVKSMIRVFYKDEALYKEVINMMEPILELEIDKYINALDVAMEKYEIVAEKVQEAEEKLKETEGKVQEAESKAQEAESKAQEAESKAQEAESKAQEAESKAREAENKAQEAEEKAQIAEGKVLDITNRYEKNVNELKNQMNEKDKRIQELQKQLQALQK